MPTQPIASRNSGNRVGAGVRTRFMTEDARLAGAEVPANALVEFFVDLAQIRPNATVRLLNHSSELLARAVQMRLHRAHRQIQQPRDLFIGSIFHVKQHHHLAIILGQLADQANDVALPVRRIRLRPVGIVKRGELCAF